MTLWLVRHAKPQIAPGICYGALDLEADPAQTDAAAQALAAALPAPPAPIVARVSSLRRCLQLSESLEALRPDIRFSLDERLREMDFGNWEGVPWADIPRAAIDAWTADFADHRFGGRESANEVLQRVHSAWAEAQADRTRGAQVVWITHNGVAQAAQLLAAGRLRVEQAKDWPETRLNYGDWIRF